VRRRGEAVSATRGRGWCRWRHLAAAVALLVPTSLPALQLRGALDLGTGPARWDQGESEGARARGALGASYRLGPVLGLVPELSSGLGLTTEEAARTAYRWDLSGRLHTRGAVTGAWLGAGVSLAGTSARTASLTRLEGGVRSGVGPAGLRVWLARTNFGVHPVFSDNALPSAAADTVVPGSKQIVEYTDLGTRAALDLGRYELAGTFVRRWGGDILRGSALRRLAWEVSAIWWVRPTVGLVASAGHSLPELSLALPGVRYRSLGVRLALGSPRQRGGRAAAPLVSTALAAGASRLVLATSKRLVLVGPSTSRADVMGDFTDWRSVPLVRAGDGRWTLHVALSKGVHHLNVRFNDGEWSVPAGTASVDDDFGGRTGLFVVR
jgi:hypothetical protein